MPFCRSQALRISVVTDGDDHIVSTLALPAPRAGTSTDRPHSGQVQVSVPVRGLEGVASHSHARRSSLYMA